MLTPHALRLLRPLLARPAQLRLCGARLDSRCPNDPDQEKPEDCPVCEPQKPPPCRSRAEDVVLGKRVVCCPPPRGSRPPCSAALPPCAPTCANYEGIKSRSKLECSSTQESVDKLMKEQDDIRRLEFEKEVEERRTAPPPVPPAVTCKLPSSDSLAVATDGRSYTVLAGQPPPPRCPAPRCPPHTARTPPAEQTVQLKKPMCVNFGPDPCPHQPRKLMSIDRSAGPDPDCPVPDAFEPEKTKLRSKSPEPSPLPRKHCDDKKKMGIKSRIMETLGRGRSAKSRSGGQFRGLAVANDRPKWCDNMPVPAKPPACREVTTTPAERVMRTPKSDCGPINKRHLHTSATAEAAKPLVDRDSTVAAAKKLKAALKERDGLHEVGRGRTVRPSMCEAPPTPPPPKPSGGALELRVPPGADTVCVRVSVGAGGGAAHAVHAAPCARAGPASPCGAPRPPAARGAPAPGDSGGDSWLSIKSLQQKLSGRQPCGARAAAPPSSPCTPRATPDRPETLSRLGPNNPCIPQKPTKIADIIPETIFTKSS